MGWVNLREIEREARLRLDPKIADYIAGAADDEITARANEEAYRAIGLIPRVLTGAGKPDLTTELFGQRISMPVLLAPTAFHKLVHPEGELATARAARECDTILIAALAATERLENIARESDGRAWFQFYFQPDLAVTEQLVRRAEAAGCRALVLTVDSPVFGRRDRDERNGFHDLPPGLCCENLRVAEPGEPESRVRSIAFSTELSWREIEWLRGQTSLKILLKGVADPEDARIAVECGIDGIMVSNHGGRQLDTIPATIELLPPIVDKVGRNVPVIVDGGIRRGTDVVKALALGARAVAIGRPAVWGLALDGAEGVTRVLEALRSEIERAIGLCGYALPTELNRRLLHVRKEVAPWPYSLA
jgi:4-hydroxymandelate oxidase